MAAADARTLHERPAKIQELKWRAPESSVLLIRGTFSPGLQLIVTSKALYPRARTPMAEAVRLDSREAPQREIDERKRGAAAAATAQAKARVQNKAAFRP